ncbi:MAG: DUF2067 domain-containing protein [Candidatus Heimdallarchaeota archaeon]|nr:DUF2067 domain-containing protein [Candidatus Heimdallarchaeota archaeon]
MVKSLARWTVKELVLKIESTKEAILFLEALQKYVKKVDIIADYYPGKATIKLEGAKEHIQDELELVKELHKTVKGIIYPDYEGFFDYDLTFLSKMMGKSFPVKLLEKILVLKGYETIREDRTLISKVDYETFKNLLNELDRVLSNIPYEVSTASLRNVLVIIALTKDLAIPEAIQLANEQGIIREDDYQRLKLKIEPEQAIKKCLKITN